MYKFKNYLQTKNVMNMKQKDFYKQLLDFLKKGTVSFTATKYLKEHFLNMGFKELSETDTWKLKKGNYFTIRNDTTLIAFNIPDFTPQSFMITTTHCDTPSLLLKPGGENVVNNYLKHNVMPYGGLLNYGWLDRPLSIAGRVITKQNNTLKKNIIDLKNPVAIIPSLAIHQNDKANSNLDLNMQKDLQPIFALTNKKTYLKDLIKQNIKEEILDYDLYLYNTQEPVIIDKNILLSPRIDNLTSTFSAYQAFLNNNNHAINLFVTFNNEEIGSLTKEGAESSFLLDILKRISTSLNLDLAKMLAHTFIVSSDNTHAIHPNHSEVMDETGNVYLNQGLAIIKEINSTTDGYFSSIFKNICDEAKIKYQDCTSKNDLSTGSTLSGLSLRHVSACSIDIGIPQLAMHSSYECCGLKDVYTLYKALKKFYQTDIIINKDKISLKFN